MHQYEGVSLESSCSDDGDDPDLEGIHSHGGAGTAHISFAQSVSLPTSTWQQYTGDYTARLRSRSRSRQRDSAVQRTHFDTVVEALGLSRMSFMLPLVPVAIAVRVLHVKDQNIVFVLNAIAIVPLTAILTRTTENLSERIGIALGALLNITLGNMVELIMLVYVKIWKSIPRANLDRLMLREGHYSLIMSSLLGSMLVNLLLILGLAIVFGGKTHAGQKWDVKETRTLVLGATFGAVNILVPTIAFAGARDRPVADLVQLKLSRAISVVLFVVYLVSIATQIQATIGLDETNFASNAGEEDEGRPFMAYTARSPTDSGQMPEWGRIEPQRKADRLRMLLSVLMLAISAGLASICADNLVSAIEHVLAHSPLTETFLGLVLFPLLGNTTELGTAVVVAMSNQIDLAINVSIGSASQIALFMAPVLVLIAWISHQALALVFLPFETLTLVLTMILVPAVMIFGSGHYSSGLLLCGCYVILCIAALLVK